MALSYEEAIEKLIIPAMGRWYLDSWQAYETMEPDEVELPAYLKGNFTLFSDVSKYLMLNAVDNVACIYGKERKDVIRDSNAMYHKSEEEYGIESSADLIHESMWDTDEDDDESSESESTDEDDKPSGSYSNPIDGYSEEPLEPTFAPPY